MKSEIAGCIINGAVSTNGSLTVPCAAMQRVFVTRQLPGNAIQDLVDAGLVVDVGDDSLLAREQLLQRVAGCSAVLSQLAESIDQEVLDAAGPNLRIVSNYAVGTNNVDVVSCTQRAIWVGHTPDVLTEATADIAWALLLAAARRIGEGERLIRSGAAWNWAPQMLLGKELLGATLAVIGAGRIGTAVARRAVGWKMRLLYVGRRPMAEMEALGGQRVSLQHALTTADIVSLHVPLTDATRHMIGAPQLRAMKPDAILINTARGPVVDEAALASALANAEIGAAGLDVYEQEPVVHEALLRLPNVVLSPHVGSATEVTRRKMAQVAVANILAVLSGKTPLHTVNEIDLLDTRR